MIYYSEKCQRYYRICPTGAWCFVTTSDGQKYDAAFYALFIRTLLQMGVESVRQELQRATVPPGQVKSARIQAVGGFPIRKETLTEQAHQERVRRWWS